MCLTDIVAYYCIGHCFTMQHFNSTRSPLVPSSDFFGPHLANLSEVRPSMKSVAQLKDSHLIKNRRQN